MRERGSEKGERGKEGRREEEGRKWEEGGRTGRMRDGGLWKGRWEREK